MTMVNAFDPQRGDQLDPIALDMIRRREKLLGPAYRLFYRRPVHIVRGEGVWLYDPEGNAYLDVYNNVASVGHCHPRVVEALCKQASVLNTHTRYLHDGVLKYAERLLGKFPEALGHVMFTCTGSEANDLALRVARAYTENTGLIVTRLAYHGLTSAVAELSPSLGEYVKRGNHVRLIDAPDTYRGAGTDIGSNLANSVRVAIADMQAEGIRPAALLVDTIFSSDGVFSDPAGFLQEAVGVIREAGGLFIADEVQPGFARVGTQWWGFARHGIVPDMVTIGKPMGNGHPVAGVVMKPHIVKDFGQNARYFNTFGGNPVSSAVGLAVLDVIDDEGLALNAETVGNYLRTALKELAADYPVIGDVRGAGLFTGVELVEDRASRNPAAVEAARIVDGLRERRVLISATGPGANVLKIRPPLVFTRENVDFFIDKLRDVLSEIGETP